MKHHLRESKPLARLTGLLILAMMASACSNSDSDLDGLAADTDPPGISGINPVDNYHLEITFDENVDKATAERHQNYTVIERQPSSIGGTTKPPAAGRPTLGELSPGDTLGITSVTLQQNRKTAVISFWDQMESVGYDIHVTGVKDLHGNGITQALTATFTGATDQDQTPPEIIRRFPMSGDTGVGLAQPVEVQFSEGMDGYSVCRAFYWTGPGGDVDFSIAGSHNNTFIFSPSAKLALSTRYSVGFTASVATDWASNYLAAANWTFQTTGVTDQIRPTVVKTRPADGEVNVPLGASLILTFSEAINPNSLTPGGILITPNPGEGISSWLGGNMTLSVDPDHPLRAGTNYTIIIPPGSVEDLAGNPLSGATSVSFTTGPALPSGRFSGTVAGDLSSNWAADPAGALIVAFLTGLDEFGKIDGGAAAGGSAIVGERGGYAVNTLPDDVYYPFGILDSNGDGTLDPMTGDALGVLGLDYASGDMDYDSITVAGGNTVTGADFPLYDYVAIMGTVSYDGSLHLLTLPGYDYYIGAFDTAGFNTTGGQPGPDFYSRAYPFIQYPGYVISEFGDSLQPGTYYIGAYLDTDGNGSFDEGIDLTTFYGDGSNLLPVTVTGGTDRFDIDMVFEDPTSTGSHPAVRWPDARRPDSPARQRLMRFVEKALPGTKGYRQN